MTNTQTKVARLTARVERLEAAIRLIADLAQPSFEPDAPAFNAFYIAAYRKLLALAIEMPGAGAIDLTKLTPEQQKAAFAKGFGL